MKTEQPNIMLVMYNTDRLNLKFLSSGSNFMTMAYCGPMDRDSVHSAIPKNVCAVAVYAGSFYEGARAGAIETGKPVILLNPNGAKAGEEYMFDVKAPYNRPISIREKKAVLTEFEKKVKKHHSALTSDRSRNNLRC